MSTPLTLSDARSVLEKTLAAHRKGSCDKMQAFEMISHARKCLSGSELEEFRRALIHKFETSELSTANAGGYGVHLPALMLLCLAEVCPFEQLLELVFGRYPIGEDSKLNAWLDLIRELQWIFSRMSEESFSISVEPVIQRVREFRQRTFVSPNVAPTLDAFVGTAEYIEFQRFREQLLQSSSSSSQSTAEEGPITSALSERVANALKDAEERLDGEGPFDPKTAGDLIRSAMEEAHREIVQDLMLVYGGRPNKDSDGARRAYMRETGLITAAEDIFFSAIYSLISQEASHKLIAPRETILLLYNTVSNYLLLLCERAKKTLAAHNPL